MYTSVVECLQDNEDSPRRRAARAAVGMAMSKWGCRGEPLGWDFGHLEEPLRKHCESSGACSVGKAWMLAAAVCRRRALAAGESVAPGR